MQQPTDITFPNGNRACSILIDPSEDLSETLQQIGLQASFPVLVLVGGAGSMAEENLIHLQKLFKDGLAPLAEELGVSIIDGGTDAGIMQMMGQARAAIPAQFPLIGCRSRWQSGAD
ncbi:hypothetical protein [Kovacikia minuta]|uniref:hypothetical protein n=1 Tax=Kovacikia minuta TaxID=2931930 RepID=UPI0020C7A6B0|nr:hypothetical protein [Kovacikia minuta]